MSENRTRPGRTWLGLAVVLAVGCRQGGGRVRLRVESVPAYAALEVPWEAPRVTARFGRGMAPARATPMPIGWGGVAAPPVRGARVWAVPGDGEALAVVAGTLGGAPALEVIAVDEGRVRWRSTACARVVHVTRDVIVCGEAGRLAAIAVADGAPRWELAAGFGDADGDRLVAARDGKVAVVDASTGEVLAEAAPPAGVAPETVRRACDVQGTFWMWAWGPGLAHYRLGRDGSAGAAESVVVPFPPASVDPCGATVLVEMPIAGSVEGTLYVVAADGHGLVPPGVVERAYWRGADGQVLAATARGIERLDASLKPIEVIADAQVGWTLATRGRRRLVAGAGDRPVLLEDDRPIAYLSAPADTRGAALGDTHVVGANDRVARFRLPGAEAATAIPPRYVDDPPPVPSELLDLPEPVDLATAPAIALDGAEAAEVARVIVDPLDPALVIVAAGHDVAVFDLRTRAWTARIADACDAGAVVALAATHDAILCATRGAHDGAVRAVARDGGSGLLWTWRGEPVDALRAAGGIAVVTAATAAVVLDLPTGAVLATIPADDGGAPRAVPFALDEISLVVTVERGAVVARLPGAAMRPLWAAAVDGVVLALDLAGDRVTAELAGGELYFLDPATGAAVAAGGWSRRWQPLDGTDLVLAEPVIPTGTEWPVSAYGPDGVLRFTATLAVPGPWLPGARGRDPAAPLAVASGPAAADAALLDPRTGHVRARVTLPPRPAPGELFATVVDGAPLAGAVLSLPVGIVLFPP